MGGPYRVACPFVRSLRTWEPPSSNGLCHKRSTRFGVSHRTVVVRTEQLGVSLDPKHARPRSSSSAHGPRSGLQRSERVCPTFSSSETLSLHRAAPARVLLCLDSLHRAGEGSALTCTSIRRP